jgi:site-specific recombinase XerD
MNLRQAIEQYLALKESLGFRFHTERRILQAFRQRMKEATLARIQPKAVQAFLDGNGPVTRYWERKWVALRGFYQFALARGLTRRSPLPVRAPKVAIPFTPHIYTREELQRLLQSITPEITGHLAPQTLKTLLLLLYGAGLRVSEALKLQSHEVDLQACVLHVRESKFFKTRLVPVGPKLAEVLRDYHQSRAKQRPDHDCFFQTDQGVAVSRSELERIFARLRLAAEVKRTDGGRFQPRLHDLRHAAAVHRLVAWYQQGADVSSLLPKLSAYLGHVDIAATQKYLTVTPELRRQASARFARYALGGSHE